MCTQVDNVLSVELLVTAPAAPPFIGLRFCVRCHESSILPATEVCNQGTCINREPVSERLRASADPGA